MRPARRKTTGEDEEEGGGEEVIEAELPQEGEEAAADDQQDEGGGAAEAAATGEEAGPDKSAAAAAQPQPQPPPPPPGGIICPNCGSSEIEQHDQSGASVCIECGVVVEENAIVSSVEFVEGAGGASSMVGQFVSATSSKAFTGGPGGPGGAGMRGGRYGFSRDSRETTLANGRRRIQDVASRLRLGSHFVDSAHRLFTVAVERNFVQGRRTTHVVAACLYIACRQEKSQHMLIDFSDALQVNVYTLGTCFLKFRRLLGLKLEIIDPALYVYRFAAHLDLDEKANAVALTALRLVARMKRDWIVAGRRPAGVCAAALLIAARAHGFTRKNQDVTKILRVCGLTVSTRVKEFEQTPSARMTLEQFSSMDVESEADPPVFTRNRFREARAKAIQENNHTLLESGALDDPRAGKRGKKWRETKPVSDKDKEFDDLYESLEREMRQDAEEAQASASAASAGAGASGEEEEKEGGAEDDDGGGKMSGETSQALQVRDASSANIPTGTSYPAHYPSGNNGRPLILPSQATAEEMQQSTQLAEDKLNLDEWKESMPGSMEKEFDDIFCDEEECKQKEALFNSLNKDYLALQERKESDRASAEAASKDREVDEAAQVEGRARYLSKNRGRKKKSEMDEPTTEEALLAAVSTRKISRKINYDAMSAIFDDSGGFSTDVVDDGGADQAGMEAEFI
jgi:transcription factor IIIB subunit 2